MEPQTKQVRECRLSVVHAVMSVGRACRSSRRLSDEHTGRHYQKQHERRSRQRSARQAAGRRGVFSGEPQNSPVEQIVPLEPNCSL